MKRKLQVFISSTYLDLKEERQAAVGAILEAGHIPAGMELFAAGDKSQLETIRRWIDDSDVYLLILGGRYGTMEKDSGKSYIELEYQHAVDRGMPHFALVLNQASIEAKVKRHNLSFVEGDNPSLLKQFKDMVTNKMCSFVEDTKDITIAIYKSLREIAASNPGLGWVPAKEAPDPTKMAGDLSAVARENSELHRKVGALEERIRQLTATPNRDAEFQRIYDALRATEVKYQNGLVSPLQILLDNKEFIVGGIHDALDTSADMKFLYRKIAPHLRMYGLVEDYKKPGAGYSSQRTSKLGNEFLAWCKERTPQFRKQPKPQHSLVEASADQGMAQGGMTSITSSRENASTHPEAKPQARKKPKR